MGEALFTDMMQRAVWISLILSAPILVITMVVGLGISIFQAVTQIQESTLTFVPKIFAALLLLAVLSPWFVGMAVDYTGGLLRELPKIARESKL